MSGPFTNHKETFGRIVESANSALKNAHSAVKTYGEPVLDGARSTYSDTSSVVQKFCDKTRNPCVDEAAWNTWVSERLQNAKDGPYWTGQDHVSTGIGMVTEDYHRKEVMDALRYFMSRCKCNITDAPWYVTLTLLLAILALYWQMVKMNAASRRRQKFAQRVLDHPSFEQSKRNSRSPQSVENSQRAIEYDNQDDDDESEDESEVNTRPSSGRRSSTPRSPRYSRSPSPALPTGWHFDPINTLALAPARFAWNGVTGLVRRFTPSPPAQNNTGLLTPPDSPERRYNTRSKSRQSQSKSSSPNALPSIEVGSPQSGGKKSQPTSSYRKPTYRSVSTESGTTEDVQPAKKGEFKFGGYRDTNPKDSSSSSSSSDSHEETNDRRKSTFSGYQDPRAHDSTDDESGEGKYRNPYDRSISTREVKEGNSRVTQEVFAVETPSYNVSKGRDYRVPSASSITSEEVKTTRSGTEYQQPSASSTSSGKTWTPRTGRTYRVPSGSPISSDAFLAPEPGRTYRVPSGSPISSDDFLAPEPGRTYRVPSESPISSDDFLAGPPGRTYCVPSGSPISSDDFLAPPVKRTYRVPSGSPISSDDFLAPRVGRTYRVPSGSDTSSSDSQNRDSSPGQRSTQSQRSSSEPHSSSITSKPISQDSSAAAYDRNRNSQTFSNIDTDENDDSNVTNEEEELKDKTLDDETEDEFFSNYPPATPSPRRHNYNHIPGFQKAYEALTGKKDYDESDTEDSDDSDSSLSSPRGNQYNTPSPRRSTPQTSPPSRTSPAPRYGANSATFAFSMFRSYWEALWPKSRPAPPYRGFVRMEPCDRIHTLGHPHGDVQNNAHIRALADAEKERAQWINQRKERISKRKAKYGR
ncbi:hypothetical protein BT63DRAFT_449358 [Microthyrium microscopicum]|uniref:Uncharacterized protein n=1 Tax=Microthyrium microscopicum TaxID=703497 RepID=A0A6A6UTV1_9PEZI|nr:hypothetical protein BT63DRAFT_449358 [Microthyrium microscopicum]